MIDLLVTPDVVTVQTVNFKSTAPLINKWATTAMLVALLGFLTTVVLTVTAADVKGELRFCKTWAVFLNIWMHEY